MCPTAAPGHARARALIEAIRADGALGAAEVDRRAGSARALAIELGDRLLEAEAVLAGCRPLEAMADPLRRLAELQHAELVFRANGQEVSANACRIGSAQCLYELGEEPRAIATANAALHDTLLPAADRSWACALLSLCHGRIGELDLALRSVRELALPSARACGSAAMLSKCLLTLATGLMRVVVFRESPQVHCAWPGTPPVQEPAPTHGAVLAWIEAADAALPVGQPRRAVQVMRHFVAAWGGRRAGDVDALGRIADEQAQDDPPLTLLALYHQALALRHLGDQPAALVALQRVLGLARSLGANALVRDATLQLSRTMEALGDSDGALAAYKQFAKLRVRGPLQSTPEPPLAEQAAPPHLLRNLEPAHVRRAIRYIEERLADKLTVDAVARHCGIGRRTLEIAFRAVKSCSVTDHVRQRRMVHAARLLHAGGNSVQAVARAVGYRSAAAFTREFRAQFSVSPSVWRRQAGTDTADSRPLAARPGSSAQSTASAAK